MLGNRKKIAGFTLVEMLIVVAISAFLLSTIVIYNRRSEANLLVLREQTRLVNTILRAKSLTLQKFNQPEIPQGKICGYGVHFIFNTIRPGYQGELGYILFQDLVSDPLASCDTSDHAYSGSTEDVSIITIDKALKFGLSPIGGSSIVDLVFIPPDPKVQFENNQSQSLIIVSIADDSYSRSVSVNSAGQISAN